MNQNKRAQELGYLFVVGGPGASGSSTIAQMLSDYFSLKRVYGGAIFENYLKQNGFENREQAYFSDNVEQLKEIDEKVDKIVIEESQNKNILIESKNFAALATKESIPCTVRIWVDANLFVRAQRVLLKQGKDLGINTLSEYLKNLYELYKRFKIDKERYNKEYGIKYQCPKEYNDIVINTSHMDEKETFNLILKYIKDGGYITK